VKINSFFSVAAPSLVAGQSQSDLAATTSLTTSTSSSSRSVAPSVALGEHMIGKWVLFLFEYINIIYIDNIFKTLILEKKYIQCEKIKNKKQKNKEIHI
jgi:hypothetical protein